MPRRSGCGTDNSDLEHVKSNVLEFFLGKTLKKMPESMVAGSVVFVLDTGSKCMRK